MSEKAGKGVKFCSKLWIGMIKDTTSPDVNNYSILQRMHASVQALKA